MHAINNFGCVYSGMKEEKFSCMDMAGDVDYRKCTPEVTYFHGRNIVSLLSQNQKIMALSSCEV
jgi:hypothetical protein